MSDLASWPARAWLEGADDAPVLVLGNSLGTSTAVWDALVPELSRHFRLLRYELPGHGGSPSWPGPYTIDELGAGVLGLLDAWGIGRAGYCGVSLGGMIGMWLAAHAPARIAALGLICTSACLPPAAAWQERAARVRAEGMASVAAQVVGRWFTPAYAAAEPSVVDAFLAGLQQTEAEGYAGCCEAIAGMDLLDSLPAILASTLVIAGAEDPATPRDHGAAIAVRIAGARLTVLPAAAHLAAVSSASQVGTELVSHLRAATATDQTWRAER